MNRPTASDVSPAAARGEDGRKTSVAAALGNRAKLLNVLIALVTRRPGAAIAVVAFVAAACMSGIPRLTLDSDYRAFFGPDNPDLAAYEAFQETYARHDVLLLVLVPGAKDAFTRESLGDLFALTESAWQLPFAVRVDSITNFQHVRADGDEVTIGALVEDPAALDAEALAHVRAVALAEPDLLDRLVAPAGDVAAVSVRVRLPEHDGDAIVRLARAARALAAQVQDARPGTRVLATGNVMLNAAFPEAMVADLQGVVPAMFLVIILLTAFVVRSLAATVLVLLTVVLSSLSALGLAGWLEIALTPPAMASPTIVTTIALANCVHLLTGFARQRSAGKPAAQAIAGALAFNVRPVAFTSLTTAIGFTCLNFGDAPPLRDLGNITALGVVAALVYSLLLVPAGARIAGGLGEAPPRFSGAMERWAELVSRRWRAMLLLGLLLTGALGACTTQIVLNDQFVRYFDEEIAFRRDTDFVMERLTGIYRIHYDARARGAGGIVEPDYLDSLDRFASWLAAQPEVIHVASVSDVFRRLHRTLDPQDAVRHPLPRDADLAAQYLLLYELSVPYGLDLGDRIAVDRSGTRLTATLVNIDNQGLSALVARAREWLAVNAPAQMRGDPVGAPVLFAAIARRNIEAMLLGTVVALVLIAGVLVVAFASVRAGLLSLIPNAVPAVLAFGTWALLVGEVGLALSVVTAMTLGIVVDDTVHFMSAYLRHRRETGSDAPDAVRYAFVHVGPALVQTSVVLVAGFAVLASSAFQVNQGLGQLTALVIAFALLADFTLLPALLLWLGRRVR